MLKVIYHKDGDLVADKEAMDTAIRLISRYNDREINRIKIANESVFQALRICVKRELINHKDICFKYDGVEIFIDKFGYLSEWPDGFCDVFEKMMEEMIGW